VKVLKELFQEFQAAGQPPELAKSNARRFAAEHVRKLAQKKKADERMANPLRDLLLKLPSS
jgi:hypothetical protein